MTHNKNSGSIGRLAFNVEGRIQGVGFRPFVWRLANELGLTGIVFNNSEGVRIEVQGGVGQLDEFERRLHEEQPPLAEIGNCEKISLPPIKDEENFRIMASSSQASQKVLVSPDVGVCQECLEDIRQEGNPRHGYAFANCVNCGPRFSITRQIPYDRPGTVMSCFPLCDSCAKEYGNPADRRFHAQPIACPKCGPRLWLAEKNSLITLPDEKNCANALDRSASLLAEGKILALKGLGGFQLACDAANETSVKTLRKRKRRPHKAFAIMAADEESAKRICRITEAELELLQGKARPIVLCKAIRPSPLSAMLAPDSDELGIMLPNTPMHALLFDELAKHGIFALVMTSGNPPGEPICLGNREALARLGDIADAFLLHDRDILARVDDSVVSCLRCNSADKEKNSSVFIRRARGYVPEAIALREAKNTVPVLGAGAHMKATFCLTRHNHAFVSQHLGDLDSPATADFYEESLAHLERLLEVKAGAIVHDLHPDYLSTRLGRSIAHKHDLPVWKLQHHAAHAASVLAENNVYEPALALCLDGTGLGADGTIWGGELLEMNLETPEWRRLGSFRPFALPGGEMAIRQPWRIALALDTEWKCPESLIREAGLVRKLLKKESASAMTSSCGRLFDAMAARLGLCTEISYEGQAAMRLMQAACHAAKNPAFPSIKAPDTLENNDLLQVDSKKVYHICAKIHESEGTEMAAYLFHVMLAESLAQMCAISAEKTRLKLVGLSGGVFQNRLLSEMIIEKLEKYGLKPLLHKKLPCGDGGLSFGQAVYGRQMLNAKKLSS